MEKGRDLVGVKGGGESNLCVQLVAAPERKRRKERERGRRGGSRWRVRGAGESMGRMRDGWLTRSFTDVWRGMAVPPLRGPSA